MSEKKVILVVEDDFFVRDIYRTKFTQEGFEVKVAENGTEALAVLAKRPVDLILLDIVMPQMDGFEVLEQIKSHEEWRAIPVILLTNLSQSEDVDRGIKSGANDYLVKSQLTPSEVVTKARSLLGSNQ